VWQLQSLHQTARHPEDNNSKGKQEGLRKAATRKVISDCPSPNLRKTLLAIPVILGISIILAPVTQNRACSIPVEQATVATHHQGHSSQRKSPKVERQAGNAFAAAVETTNPTFVPNTACQDHPTSTPAITAAMTPNKSSANSHLTRSSKKTSLPLSISISTGEAGWDRVRI
jgi:hypothetical protein